MVWIDDPHIIRGSTVCAGPMSRPSNSLSVLGRQLARCIIYCCVKKKKEKKVTQAR